MPPVLDKKKKKAVAKQLRRPNRAVAALKKKKGPAGKQKRKAPAVKFTESPSPKKAAPISSRRKKAPAVVASSPESEEACPSPMSMSPSPPSSPSSSSGPKGIKHRPGFKIRAMARKLTESQDPIARWAPMVRWIRAMMKKVGRPTACDRDVRFSEAGMQALIEALEAYLNDIAAKAATVAKLGYPGKDDCWFSEHLFTVQPRHVIAVAKMGCKMVAPVGEEKRAQMPSNLANMRAVVEAHAGRECKSDEKKQKLLDNPALMVVGALKKPYIQSLFLRAAAGVRLASGEKKGTKTLDPQKSVYLHMRRLANEWLEKVLTQVAVLLHHAKKNTVSAAMIVEALRSV